MRIDLSILNILSLNKWLCGAACVVTAVASYESSAAAFAGPISEPALSCTTNLTNNQQTSANWKCPVWSIGNATGSGPDWSASAVGRVFVDYTNASFYSYPDALDGQLCETSWSGGQVICGAMVRGPNNASASSATTELKIIQSFPGSHDMWDYYYVNIVGTAIHSVCSPATLQSPGGCILVGWQPTLLGIGWTG